MSHYTDIGEKNTEDEILLYLNGFFCAMEILNSRVNDSKTMYVERIQKQLDKTRPEVIKRHLNEPSYKVELEPIDNFQERLSALLPSYCQDYIFQAAQLQHKALQPGDEYVKINTSEFRKTRIHLADKLNGNLITERVFELINLLISKEDIIFEVKIDWSKGSFYECYHHNYLIEKENQFLFLHFGGSD